MPRWTPAARSEGAAAMSMKKYKPFNDGPFSPNRRRERFRSEDMRPRTLPEEFLNPSDLRR